MHDGLSKKVVIYSLIILPCVLLTFMDLVFYNKIGALAQARHMDFQSFITLPWDKDIPYLNYFVLPYVFAWVYPLIVLLQMLYKKGPQLKFFIRVYVVILAVFVFCYVVWIAFPVRFDLGVSRHFLQSGSWLDHLTLWVYGDSSFYNSFPSFHIIIPCLVYLMVRHVTGDRYQINAVLTLLIILSTLFIRIHYIMDVVSGILMGYLFYIWWLYLGQQVRWFRPD